MNTHGFILAAGYGTRMGVLSDCRLNRFSVAKPALPIGIRSQVRQQLYLLHLMGIKQATVAVKFKSDTVREAIGDTSNFTMNVDVFDMDENQVEDWGAAWTTYKWFSSLSEKPKQMVVLNGDILWDKTLAKPSFDAFLSSSAWGQIVGCSTPLEQLLGRFGLIQTDLADSGSVRKIKAFLEKPTADIYQAEMGNIANVGIFNLDSRVFEHFTDILGQGFADFAAHLFQRGMLEHGLPLETYIAPPGFYWKDIGTPLDLLQANFDVLNGKIDAGPQGTEIRPGIFIGKDCEIADSALDKMIGPVIIGDNVYIGPNAVIQNSVIGAGWQIMPFSQINHSVLLPGFYGTKDNLRYVASNAKLDRVIACGGRVEPYNPADIITNRIIVVSPDGIMAWHEYDFKEAI